MGQDVSVPSDAIDAFGPPDVPDRADEAALDASVDSPLDASVGTDAADTMGPLRVLFIGNSYTYVNDLPGTIRALGAATPGFAIEVDSVVEPGARLWDHLDHTGARARIASRPWNIVVIQGQSLEPVTENRSFTTYAVPLANAVRDAGARTVWYETWARRAGEPFYRGAFEVNYGATTPDIMTSRLDGAYQALANANGGIVARAGIAWQRSLRDLPAINLYDPDGSHPSPEGTLLTACVMFQSITGHVPRVPDPPPLGVAADRARALCDIAPSVYRETDRVAGAIPVCGTSPLQTLCGTVCIDLAGDWRNCGACGVECLTPRWCSAGACRCPSTYSSTASYASLSAFEPRCNGSDERFGSSCNAAVHRMCVAQGCTNAGSGSETSGAALDATCFSGNIYETTYRSLRRWDSSCDGVADSDGEHCARAIDAYCVSRGDFGGFGPIAITGDALGVTCVPPAGGAIERIPLVAWRSWARTCDGILERWGPDCRFVSQTMCRARGHAGSYGLVSMSSDGTSAEIRCIRR